MDEETKEKFGVATILFETQKKIAGLDEYVEALEVRLRRLTERVRYLESDFDSKMRALENDRYRLDNQVSDLASEVKYHSHVASGRW